MVARGSGRIPERDAALILCSATTGLRVTEIANLEVRHIITEDGKEVTIEYKACDVLERAFKRFYKRAFGEETDFSSHSGRKYFACQLANILDRKAEEHEFYDDVVELMRSQNLTAIQPYLMPTKEEIIKAAKTIID